RRWPWLVSAAAAGAGAQALALAASAPQDDAASLVACAATAAVVLAAGVARPLRDPSRDAEPFAASLLLGAPGLAPACSLQLMPPGEGRGVALLGAGAIAALAAAISFRPARDLATVASACAFALAAVGTADLASGSTLTIAWSAQAILMTVLGVRLGLP